METDRRVGQWATLLALGLALSGCASWRAIPALPQPVQQALAKADMPESALGIVAYPLDDPAHRLQRRADDSMQPGSTMKLVTAVVALDTLGATQRGRTELLVDAPVRDGVLDGPLYLRGGADAELDWGALSTLLRRLRDQHGLREIRGGLVVDRGLFTPSRLDIGQPSFDESPEFPYNVIPDALLLNGNLLQIQLQADAARIEARSFPALPGLRVDASAMRLNDRPCRDWEAEWQLPRVTQDASGVTVALQGGFPRQCRIEQALNLVDRQWLTAAALRQIWNELGGTLSGPELEGRTPAGARVLATHLDRPLGELINGVMKRSDNPLTRLIYLRLGAASAQPGEDSAAAAERRVKAWFQTQGIPVEGLVMDNGSGLSRAERITPRQMEALLLALRSSRYAPELMASLPLAGVDGTLSRRLKGTAAEGRARLKTGTLRDAVGLAGFVTDAGGRSWLLVALLNHQQASAKGRPVLDALAEWVASQR